ncbi:MAG TPA: sigma-54 dependent transcriptional regulator [Pyrinomonadaceae bacterium]|nr:sigma-54 dependent transcriptional regulator [Pyrinomonadaceae bacterium]
MIGHTGKITVVDDDESIRKATTRLIESAGYEVDNFGSAEEFLKSGRVDDSNCLILDVRLPGMNGLELQEHLVASNNQLPIIFVTAQDDRDVRERALRAGAVDFLQKPFTDAALVRTINTLASNVKTTEIDSPSDSNTVSPFISRTEGFGFDQIVGHSPVMRETLRLASRVAESEVSSVLLQGESGTGKDMVAKAIHTASNRSAQPFIAINCAVLPPNLIESELFGHEKGAFTDARARKEGLLEQAHGGGTIFLDEISEIDINLQAKLLRVLEERCFRRVGGLKDVPFGARVIAASNRDLKHESDVGRFRLDLYYRLAVIQIDIPRLAARDDDVLLLAQHFLDLSSHEGRRKITGLTAETARAFRLYDWPGNVRELRNVIERAMILEDSNMISTRHLPRDIVPDAEKSPLARVNVIGIDATVSLPPQGISLQEVEKSLLKQALAQTHGNQTRASELLGLTRDQFRYRLKKIRQLAAEQPKFDRARAAKP